MGTLFVKPASCNQQFEEFGVFLEQSQIGNLFVYYDRGSATVDGSIYLPNDLPKPASISGGTALTRLPLRLPEQLVTRLFLLYTERKPAGTG
ncbi:hypothetical protein [Effusibacillus pohliae]|uniref:hypothetical protein n=1 Tax=Effusibacillus pohliae TaxID=232270 RepID=UPI000366EB32|nr:hypothetical protein [Effusibacillus pohliae]